MCNMPHPFAHVWGVAWRGLEDDCNLTAVELQGQPLLVELPWDSKAADISCATVKGADEESYLREVPRNDAYSACDSIGSTLSEKQNFNKVWDGVFSESGFYSGIPL